MLIQYYRVDWYDKKQNKVLNETFGKLYLAINFAKNKKSVKGVYKVTEEFLQFKE